VYIEIPLQTSYTGNETGDTLQDERSVPDGGKKMDYTHTSRFMSLILRHKPEIIGISLDEHGWADVDVELDEVEPPEILWHGTAEKSVAGIEEAGLLPMSRLYVHLSEYEETARKVGARHGKLVLYHVKAGEMHRAGHKFYLSKNGVWLVKTVPVEYLERQ